jgi:hypothetical protein
MSFPMFRPALRVVNAFGNPTMPPLALYLSTAAEALGITVGRSSCTYGKEELGPFQFADYAQGPSLLGFRPHVELDFAAVLFDNHEPGAYGLSLLRAYYLAGTQILTPDFAPLQVNMFSDNPASPWRGVFVASDWDPAPQEGMQTSPGVTWSLKLYARDLIDEPGDWAARTW